MITGPKYRHVFETIRKKIDSGELQPGDRIPSTKALCDEFDCSSTAVNTAIILLVNEGYIIGQPGLGRFVADAD